MSTHGGSSMFFPSGSSFGMPAAAETMKGGRVMKDYERSFRVISSSFGITGGRYVHGKMSRAAFKAGRALFAKAEKANRSARDNKVVDFELAEITMGRSKTAKKGMYRMTRAENKGAPKMMTIKGVSFQANKFTYTLEKLGANASTVDHR